MPVPPLTPRQARMVAFPRHKTKRFLEGTAELRDALENDMTTEVIEADSREVAVVPPAALFAGSTPADVAIRMKDTAVALKGIIEAAHGSDGKPLVMKIPGLNGAYVRCEGWTTLGAMLSVFPVNVWTRELSDGKGYEARVEARTLNGNIVGAAEAMCSKDEQRWATADKYALRSMAQTRATSKALRMPLGFVMTLAGYEATPAEEMDFAQKPKGRAPSCKMHQKDLTFIRGGVSKKTQKPYGAFWKCSVKDCRTSVDDDAWQAHLTQQDAEKEPAPAYDPNDVPNDEDEERAPIDDGDAKMEHRPSESEGAPPETAGVPPVVVGDSTMAMKKTIRGLLGKIDALPPRPRETFYAGLLSKYPKCAGTDGKVHLTPLDKAEAEDIIATAGAYLREGE